MEIFEIDLSRSQGLLRINFAKFANRQKGLGEATSVPPRVRYTGTPVWSILLFERAATGIKSSIKSVNLFSEMN